MSAFAGVRTELRPLLRLAVPVVVVQVGMMLMGVVDTMMVGRVSPTALAAVALGNTYFFAVVIFGIGVLMALDPVVAQAVGAGDRTSVARGLQRGLIISVALTFLSALLLLPAAPVLRALQQPADVVPVAAGYALIIILGNLPFFAFVVLRQTLQAMGRMAPIVATMVVANIVNGFLNWVLIFGELGTEPMGALGSAWASVISRWFMGLALLAVSWKVMRPYLVPFRRDALDARPLGRMLVLGAPIGAQFQLEFGAFAVIALFMGWMGTVEMAAHHVAINLASFTFMVPMGIGAAASVLVGQAVGRDEPATARSSAAAAVLVAIAFMSVSAAVMLMVPEWFARLYTTQLSVAALAAALIPIAGAFQIFDGIQVVATGVLRGIGDTRWPMFVNVAGFWCVGMPVSLWLGFRTDAGPLGLWWGLVAGLAAVAIFLLARVRLRLGRELRRVVIDEEPPPVLVGTADDRTPA